jgi:hypothetical protein
MAPDAVANAMAASLFNGQSDSFVLLGSIDGRACLVEMAVGSIGNAIGSAATGSMGSASGGSGLGINNGKVPADTAMQRGWMVAYHDAPVSSVALCPSSQICISASLDGFLHVVSVRDRSLLYRLGRGKGYPITWAGISHAGVILYYSAFSRTLHAHSLSGVEIAVPLRIPFDAVAFAWGLDGQGLLVGGDGPYVLAIDAFTLTVRCRIGQNGAYLPARPRVFPGNDASPTSEGDHSASTAGTGREFSTLLRMEKTVIPFESPVTALALAEHEQALFVGLADGQIRIFTHEGTESPAKILRKLEDLVGF